MDGLRQFIQDHIFNSELDIEASQYLSILFLQGDEDEVNITRGRRPSPRQIRESSTGIMNTRSRFSYNKGQIVRNRCISGGSSQENSSSKYYDFDQPSSSGNVRKRSFDDELIEFQRQRLRTMSGESDIVEKVDDDTINNNVCNKRQADSLSTLDLRRTKRARTDYGDERNYNLVNRHRDGKGHFDSRQMDKMDNLERENMELKAKISELQLSLDCNSLFNEEMEKSLYLQMSDMSKVNRDLSHKLVDQDRTKEELKMKLRDQDKVIGDLEQHKDNLETRIKRLKNEMERDFIECENCKKKFRSNDILRRHKRFDCNKYNRKTI